MVTFEYQSGYNQLVYALKLLLYSTVVGIIILNIYDHLTFGGVS